MKPARIIPLVALLLAFTASTSAQVQWPVIPPAGSKERQDEVNKRIAILKAADAELHDKFVACRELSVLGDKSVVPVLAALLSDEKLSHMARYGLEPIQDPSVDEAFRDAIGKLKGPQLVGLLSSIGNRRDAKAVEPVSALLKGPDADVACAAAYALGKIGGAGAAKALEDSLGAAPDTVKASIHDGLIYAGDNFLQAGSLDQARDLYDRLIATKPAGRIYMAAQRGAVLSRGAAAGERLVQLIKSDDDRDFAVALRLVNELQGEALTRASADQLDKILGPKAALLAQALGNRGDKAAIDKLISLAKAGETPARIAAIKALAQLGDGSSVALLVGLARGEGEVAKAAQVALAIIIAPEADAALGAALAEGDAKLKGAIIGILAQRRAPSSAAPLLKAAGDANDEVRLAAISAFGEVATTDDLAGMINLLVNAKSDAELAAADKGLASLAARAGGKEAATAPLLAALASAKPAVKPAILRGLRAAGGPKALAAIRAAAADPDAALRDAGIRALCDWPGVEAAPDLLKIAQTSTDVTHKTLALRGYLRLASDASAPLAERMDMLKQASALADRPEDKRKILGLLSAIPTPEALALVMSHLATPAVKEEAASAAVKIAEKLDESANRAVVEAMTKVVEVTKAADVKKKAQAVLGRAKNGGK